MPTVAARTPAEKIRIAQENLRLCRESVELAGRACFAVRERSQELRTEADEDYAEALDCLTWAEGELKKAQRAARRAK